MSLDSGKVCAGQFGFVQQRDKPFALDDSAPAFCRTFFVSMLFWLPTVLQGSGLCLNHQRWCNSRRAGCSIQSVNDELIHATTNSVANNLNKLTTLVKADFLLLENIGIFRSPMMAVTCVSHVQRSYICLRNANMWQVPYQFWGTSLIAFDICSLTSDTSKGARALICLMDFRIEQLNESV